MTLPNTSITPRHCKSCMRHCPESMFHRGAVICKVCVYEKGQKKFIRMNYGYKPERILAVEFNLRQSNLKVLNEMMQNVSSIGGHLQSIFAFKVNIYEKMIVQLNVNKEGIVFTVYKPMSSQAHMIIGMPTEDGLDWIGDLNEQLAKYKIRLAKTDLALKTAIYSLQNEW